MKAVSGCSWVPKLARECGIKHWLVCGVDGRSLGVRSSDYQIFSDGLIILAKRARGAPLKYFYYNYGILY